MKLSIFTTITNPEKRGDNMEDAINCYKDLADEVIIIDGKDTWPEEFSWELIGQHFQKGYEQATGDWVIHADLDFIFHENDFAAIRKAMEINNSEPALAFLKYQFILPDRYTLKSRLLLAVNKAKFGDRIRFDAGGDLCQPSLDGVEIQENTSVQTRIPFYNYEKMTKNKDQITNDVERMERAYQRLFDKPLYTRYDTNAYEGWLKMAHGRFNKLHKIIKLSNHPKYVQDTIRNLTPDQFGYSMFGLKENTYV